MSTRPKIKKYRVRRGSSLLSSQSDQPVGDGVSSNTRNAGLKEMSAGRAPHLEGTHQHNELFGAATSASTTPRKGRVFGIDISGKTIAAPQEISSATTTDTAAETNTNTSPQTPTTPRHVPDTTSSAPLPEGEATSSKDSTIAAIRKEDLTGRELRMARRMAVRHNITASSDYDAIRQLREQGIDPFKRKNMLEIVAADPQKGSTGSHQLPQKVAPRKTGIPGPALAAEDTRAAEIRRIQLDIARRRRLKLIMLTARLIVFILLPTIVTGYYYYNVATPLYATHSQFLIQQSEAPTSSSGLGGLLSGSPLASSQDSLTVQSYLQSRAAMQRLDNEEGFIAHFSQEDIDPLTRLEAVVPAMKAPSEPIHDM